jgi:magnesium-transporting ATPase (P-type)
MSEFFSKLTGGKKKDAMNDAVSGTEAIRTWDDHRIGIQKLCEKFDTNIATGLTEEKATAGHVKYGVNALSKKEGTPWYCLFLAELTGPFALLLWVGGILNEIAYGVSDRSDPTSLYLGIVLMAIVIFTAVFAYA